MNSLIGFTHSLLYCNVVPITKPRAYFVFSRSIYRLVLNIEVSFITKYGVIERQRETDRQTDRQKVGVGRERRQDNSLFS